MFYVESGKPTALQFDDVLLLCSDGLWGGYTELELACAFATEPVAPVLNRLVAEAVVRGATQADNATGIAMRYLADTVDHYTPQPVCHILKIS